MYAIMRDLRRYEKVCASTLMTMYLPNDTVPCLPTGPVDLFVGRNWRVLRCKTFHLAMTPPDLFYRAQPS